MSVQVLLITPPFTQLNTPYPATAYLKGFLNTKNVSSYQVDLGIDVILRMFSKQGLVEIFSTAHIEETTSTNCKRIFQLRDNYLNTIDNVVLFLQGKHPTLAYQIVQESFLPRASRFQHIEDMVWAFGNMGMHDKAKHLATLYLEDIADFINECIDEHFGFSRYAERLARSAHSFDELYDNLHVDATLVERYSTELLHDYILEHQPQLVAISTPFPGNVLAAFRCGQYLKSNFPEVKIALGGGFVNTELRSLQDTRVFEFFDFISLDDGETPIENLLHFIQGKIDKHACKRTFMLDASKVEYFNTSLQRDYKQSELGTPDYSDLRLDKYISVIEIANPMHKLWSDGRWNKLTMAHGCYWGKCTFCDISLDYIKNYEPLTATMLADRMEAMVKQTSENGFHFVDEAAPPSLMKALALEIIKRKLIVTWWANVRFEKSFTQDLCYLLKASGCIAVSGGLEVASDRLLQLIDKGVTVRQVAKVNQAFTRAGIMVHAYLMYGFPTQTAQETIDSLEMVRQLFKSGVLQSGFWHQFAMTAHSPVGLNPEKYKVKKVFEGIGTFANNDIEHTDTTGAKHELFSFGLQKSLFNYMHHIGLDENLQHWFEHKVPKTLVEADYIETCLAENAIRNISEHAKLYWLGNKPEIVFFIKSKKGVSWQMAELIIETNVETLRVKLNEAHGKWLCNWLERLSMHQQGGLSFQALKSDYESHSFEDDFELLWYNKIYPSLQGKGLLCV